MHQMEFLTDSEKRFGVTEKQISMVKQIGAEVLNNSAFGTRVKINKDVAAQDQVHSIHERHAGVIG